MENRGALSVFFLITIIIAIAGFIPVLYLIINYLGDTSLGVDEACKMSVLTRATAPASAQPYVPLKCTTKKICLTQSIFGKCKQFAGEKDVTRITLPSNDEKAARKIEEISAQAMYYCWQTMGQGKLDLFGSFGKENGFDQAKSACVICSRVAIDEEVKEEVLELTDINKYMQTNNPPMSSLTYLETFTDKNVKAYAKINDKSFIQNLEENKKIIIGGKEKPEVTAVDNNDVKLTEETKPNREMAIVFMQIKSPSVKEVLSNLASTGATAAGATFITPFVGTLARRVVFTPVGAGITVIGAAAVAGYGAYNTKQGQLAAAGYCGKFASNKEGEQTGCSLVQGVNYHFKDVNALCHKIEGNP